MKSFRRFCGSLINPQFAPTAVRVALVVGTLLFAINHGRAAINGDVTRDRWLSGALFLCLTLSMFMDSIAVAIDEAGLFSRLIFKTGE